METIAANVNGWMTAAGARLGLDDPAAVLGELGRLTAEYRQMMDRDFGGEVRTRRLDFRCSAPGVVPSRDAMAG